LQVSQQSVYLSSQDFQLSVLALCEKYRACFVLVLMSHLCGERRTNTLTAIPQRPKFLPNWTYPGVNIASEEMLFFKTEGVA